MRRLSPDALAGATITALGAWFMLQALDLREGPGYAAVGPRVFPLLVGAGLLISGLFVALGGVRSARIGAETGDEPAEEQDWATLVQVGLVLAAFLALYLPLGFTLASAFFLPACAWVLGSRSPGRDLLAGMLVSVATYYLFTQLLGLELPQGLLPLPTFRGGVS